MIRNQIYAELFSLFLALFIIAMAVFTSCDKTSPIIPNASAQQVWKDDGASAPNPTSEPQPPPHLVFSHEDEMRQAVVLILIDNLCERDSACRLRVLGCFLKDGGLWNKTTKVYKCHDSEPKP